jgi:hypothetical protein
MEATAGEMTFSMAFSAARIFLFCLMMAIAEAFSAACSPFISVFLSVSRFFGGVQPNPRGWVSTGVVPLNPRGSSGMGSSGSGGGFLVVVVAAAVVVFGFSCTSGLTSALERTAVIFVAGFANNLCGEELAERTVVVSVAVAFGEESADRAVSR